MVAGTEEGMNMLTQTKRVRVIATLVEGNRIRAKSLRRMIYDCLQQED